MLQKLLWALLALIHFLPALAFFRPVGVTQLYGIERGDPLFLLMHHRAALFLAVFVACVWALFDPMPRKLALAIAAISMVSFLFLFWQAGNPAALRRIAIADAVGIPALLILAYLNFRPVS